MRAFPPRRDLLVAGALLAVGGGLGRSCVPAGSGPPNLVLVFADDLGYGDLGCYGAEPSVTPHLDRLAAEGVRFTDFYVAQPVCSASRAALLTGCYPNRVGIHGALGPGAQLGLADEELTLAEVCKARGYATAIFGKWHLGHLPPFLPTRHGFDEYFGLPYSNDMWPFHPESPAAWPDLPTLEGTAAGGTAVVAYNEQRRLTAELTRRAVAFVEASAAREVPFFLYLAHPMPHVPLFASAPFRGSTGRGLYADVLAEVDHSVGELRATLARLGLAESTLFLFASDNGPWLSYGDHAGSAGPLREGKGTTFDGGVRVPFLASWSGVLPAGRVTAEPAMTIDVLPTVARLLEVPLPEHTIDGLDLWPLLTGAPVPAGGAARHAALFFYYHQGDLEAVRSGPWKLHFPHGYRSMLGREPGRGGVPGKYDYDVRTGLELYDLVGDPGERTDLAAERPEVVERLQALAEGARAELGDGLTQAPGRGVRPPGRL